MKEHKNHKVRSEGILWMVSAVVDFGVSHLKLKDYIDFVKEIGLQSSAVATRNASIKLLGVLHKFVVPDIKGFLTDVKPALLSALDIEYEKNPFEGASTVPRKLSGHQIHPHPLWLVGWIACIVKILLERLLRLPGRVSKALIGSLLML
ncbi:unnamed protein product [Trifolium pratense]|uniref:Uncharacterized protein n=1 Tax=Trifolium pratense TaxID=57577 RepID=A0ACB0JEQ4_TRIPR|nr:unnamed protein product [Trifolium pratense]